MPFVSRNPLPDPTNTQLVVAAPGEGPGNWAGAASALRVDGVYWLAYRVRRPLAEGRGVEVVVARSDDGVAFESVVKVSRDLFGCESLERPVLVALPDGGWRLYVSCATWDSKHWWVDSLTAPTPELLPVGDRQVVLPGDGETAVKDPVIVVEDGGWHMWLCCHPLTETGQEDRMTTSYLTSGDGLDWADHGQVLAGRPGEWDERGARVTTITSFDPLVVLYDGRPDAASNWHETTGVAYGKACSPLTAASTRPLSSPHSDGAFRYASAVRLPDGDVRFYIEAARPDGAHDLVTTLWHRDS